MLAAGETAEGGTDIAGALAFLNRVCKRRAVVFLVSDFMTEQDYARTLRITAHHHDVICATIADPTERTLPEAGLVELEDPETSEIAAVDTSDRAVQAAFAARAAADQARLARLLAKAGVDRVDLSTDRPYVNDIRALFKRRARKR